MASGFQLGHVGLSVRDVDRSAAFYRTVLGLGEVGGARDGERRYVLLARDGQVLLTLWEQSDRPFAADHAGLHHLSFHVPDAAAVETVAQRARDAGAPIRHGGVVRHRETDTSGGLFFEDPDGIRLEVFTDDVGGEAPAPFGTAPTCGFF